MKKLVLIILLFNSTLSAHLHHKEWSTYDFHYPNGYERTEEEYVKEITIKKEVRTPQSISKPPIPVPIHVPYPIPVPHPYPVIQNSHVPVTRPITINLPLIRKIEFPIPRILHLPAPKSIPVPVPVVQPVYIEKKVPIYVPAQNVHRLRRPWG